MKELSIEQKAQKYDEAIERAKGVIEKNPLMEYLKKGIEYIFPKLKENWNEKVRKWLIEMVEEVRKANPTNAEHNGMCSEAIAWLEKQSEQKPAKWSEDDKRMFVNIKACLRNANKDYGRELDWLKSLKGRVQPVQKWNGSDDAHIHSIITHLQDFIESHPNTTGADIQGENVAWLKSLRPQVIWSEEDTRILREIILDLKVLQDRDTGEEGKAAYQEEINWLETLNPSIK